MVLRRGVNPWNKCPYKESGNIHSMDSDYGQERPAIPEAWPQRDLFRVSGLKEINRVSPLDIKTVVLQWLIFIGNFKNYILFQINLS